MPSTDFGSLARKIRGGESATAQEMKDTPPEITVTRRKNRQGLIGSIDYIRPIVSALNSRHIEVTLNGQLIGVLNENQSIKCSGVSGINTVGIGTNGNVGKIIEVYLENGMRKRFFCSASMGTLELREAL